jgi:hypothetical protein
MAKFFQPPQKRTDARWHLIGQFGQELGLADQRAFGHGQHEPALKPCQMLEIDGKETSQQLVRLQVLFGWGAQS